jgi:hypothetical protein
LGKAQWVVKGVLDVDSLIRANPSIEGGENEGVNDQTTKVVDSVDIFRLQGSPFNKYFYPHYNYFQIPITKLQTLQRNLEF